MTHDSGRGTGFTIAQPTSQSFCLLCAFDRLKMVRLLSVGANTGRRTFVRIWASQMSSFRQLKLSNRNTVDKACQVGQTKRGRRHEVSVQKGKKKRKTKTTQTPKNPFMTSLHLPVCLFTSPWYPAGSSTRCPRAQSRASHPSRPPRAYPRHPGTRTRDGRRGRCRYTWSRASGSKPWP